MKEIVLGLLGLGNIGGGVWDLIREFGDETAKRTGVKLRVKRALVLDKKIHGGKEVPDEVLTTDKDDILEDPEIQIVCEFLGGEQPAASWMLRALENGKSVVTANKMALSLHFDELRAMARKTGHQRRLRERGPSFGLTTPCATSQSTTAKTSSCHLDEREFHICHGFGL